MRLTRRHFSLLLPALALLAPLGEAAMAQDAAPAAMAQDAASAATSPWAPSAKSRTRLLGAGGLETGAYRAGVEIALSGHALTYWRQPGDAGAPPVFDFSASQNVASVDIAYPAPERHDEAGAEAFGWRGEVIFPLRVRPKDATKPVTLDLDLRYAACENICVPAEGRMRLTLTPQAAPSAQAPRIAAWEARTPKPAAPGAIVLSPEPAAQTPNWRVTITPVPDASADLFAEGDEGWYFETRREGDSFRMTLAEKPREARSTIVRFTYRGAQGALEQETRLDAAAASP